MDVRKAFDYTMKAAEKAGGKPDTFERILSLVAGERCGVSFVSKLLCREIGIKETSYQDVFFDKAAISNYIFYIKQFLITYHAGITDEKPLYKKGAVFYDQRSK
ncbi:MAG: hypothetical protein ACMUIM_11840 [bacterium]